MNKGLKWTLIISGVVGVGVGLYFLLRKKKKKLNNTNSTTTNNTNNSNSSTMNATAENGKIVITSGNNTYKYQLQGYALWKWWNVAVNQIDLENKAVTYTNPQTNQQSTDELEQWVVEKITQGVGDSYINMGETSDGTKIRLVLI